MRHTSRANWADDVWHNCPMPSPAHVLHAPMSCGPVLCPIVLSPGPAVVRPMPPMALSCRGSASISQELCEIDVAMPELSEDMN